ncbi:DnaJ homolog subfamily C member 2 [Tanacetum coccineum]
MDSSSNRRGKANTTRPWTTSEEMTLCPFAPLNLTAGDIRVGQGPAIQPTSPPRYSQEPDPPKRSRFRAKKIDQDDNFMTPFTPLSKTLEPISSIRSNEKDSDGDKNAGFTEEKEWSDGDLELLKKQMVKNPVGMPGRWEAVAEVFNGRHKVESVVKMAKSMGDKRMGGGDGDSFSRFLKDRKAVDKRVDEVIESEREENKVAGNGGGGSWSSSEDIALLNALKAFPKDVAMRWEKITAAVPGRSKAACMKRVADLKKDFRSSKTSSEA